MKKTGNRSMCGGCSVMNSWLSKLAIAAAFFVACFVFAPVSHAATFTSCGLPDAGSMMQAANQWLGGRIPYEPRTVTGPTKTTVSCGAATGPGYSATAQNGNDYHFFYTVVNAPYYVPSLHDSPEKFDEEGCFLAYGKSVCPGDEGWLDEEGFDDEGFDSDGKDRGGKTEAQGGGYNGTAGTGGSSPQLSGSPPSDPQNGNNVNQHGILVCHSAYPGYTIDTSPAVFNYAAPGLICANQCQYGLTGTSFDFASGYAYNNYAPSGSPCNGEEANISLNIGTHTSTPPPAQPEYSCYLQGSIWECYQPGNYNYPDVCFMNVSGTYGSEVQCPTDVSSELSEGTLCGQVNGYYTCFAADDGCKFMRGSLVCFAPGSTTPIPGSSPDHPKNGGNGDGNPNNDVFQDENDVANNGYTPQQQQQNSVDHQRLAGAIDNALANDFASITSKQNTQTALLGSILDQLEGGIEIDVGEFEQPDGNGLYNDAAATQDAFLDDLLSGERSFDGSIVDGLTGALGDYLPAAGSCSVFTFDLLPAYGLVVDLDTCDLELARYMAEWLCAGMTLMLCISLVLRSPSQSEA